MQLEMASLKMHVAIMKKHMAEMLAEMFGKVRAL